MISPANSFHRCWFVIALLSVFGTSCETARRVVKAKPTSLTPFLEDFENVERAGRGGPFHAAWVGATREQLAQSAKRTEIYIAPVETRYLRPIGKSLAAGQHAIWDKQRPVAQIATRIRTEFVAAFANSRDPRYVPVDASTRNSVTLRLSLVELDPTSVTGNAAKKAASFFVGPASAAASVLTKGSIAIEGQLRDTAGNWLLLQFADKEKDKITFWTLRDFRPYGHATVAIREWAEQFEELTRNPRWREMGDSRAWTLRPW